MVTEARRASVAFALADANGGLVKAGESEAAIDDDALVVGPISVSHHDADGIEVADYRIRISLWPEGRLELSQPGRRFDTFAIASHIGVRTAAGWTELQRIGSPCSAQ